VGKGQRSAGVRFWPGTAGDCGLQLCAATEQIMESFILICAIYF